jgi:hypothetical protein
MLPQSEVNKLIAALNWPGMPLPSGARTRGVYLDARFIIVASQTLMPLGNWFVRQRYLL